jgi:iron complex outermembrane receptor protein
MYRGIAGGAGNNIQINSVGYAPNSFLYENYDADQRPIQGAYVDRNADGK